MREPTLRDRCSEAPGPWPGYGPSRGRAFPPYRTWAVPSPFLRHRSVLRVRWGTALWGRAPAIEFLSARRPAFREGAEMLLGVRIPRLGRDLSRDTNALLDDLAVAELGKALGRDQHARERAFAPRPEQGGEVGLSGLCHRGCPEPRPRPQGSIGVPGRDYTFPVTGLHGGRVRLAP